MTAQAIGIFTIDFPDPNVIDYDNNNFTTLNESLGFQDRIQSAITTLSTKDVDPGTEPYGLLYVPDLQSDDCRASEKAYVPANATRLDNLPVNKDYALIALAPWYNSTCMTEYFAAARQNPTKAVLVYQPASSNAKPPVLNDASWDLEDGGEWQTQNTFPTYAISPAAGSIVMAQLDKYSTNLTNVPNGPQLATIYNTTDYIRLWASVDTDPSSQLPSLWVFLVIVMAILLLAVTTTSIAMHVIQRRRRNNLRQRVVNGEVDLEALGVKRLNVSQQVLDKLPIYTYTAGSREAPEKTSSDIPAHAANVEAETGDKPAGALRPVSTSTLPPNSMSASWSQPTCPICLDDFVVDETQVRELPCHHVFHPDCIDTFLLRNSSLCPLCKQSVLPKGDCPVIITNVMVRRERHITRMRQRSANGSNTSHNGTQPNSAPTWLARVGISTSPTSRLGRIIHRRRLNSVSSTPHAETSDIEMANANTTITSSSPPPPPPPAAEQPPVPPSTTETSTEEPHLPITEPQPTADPTDPAAAAAAAAATTAEPPRTPSQSRREWANQRALALLGHRTAPPSEVEDDNQRRPAWRRFFRKIFPGFR